MLIICLLNCEDDYWLSYPRSICSVTTKQKWWKLGACARVQIFCWHETQAFHDVGVTAVDVFRLDMYQSFLKPQICSWFHILWIFLRKKRKNDVFFRIFLLFLSGKPPEIRPSGWRLGWWESFWNKQRMKLPPVGRRRAINGLHLKMW